MLNMGWRICVCDDDENSGDNETAKFQERKWHTADQCQVELECTFQYHSSWFKLTNLRKRTESTTKVHTGVKQSND